MSLLDMDKLSFHEIFELFFSIFQLWSFHEIFNCHRNLDGIPNHVFVGHGRTQVHFTSFFFKFSYGTFSFHEFFFRYIGMVFNLLQGPFIFAVAMCRTRVAFLFKKYFCHDSCCFGFCKSEEFINEECEELATIGKRSMP